MGGLFGKSKKKISKVTEQDKAVLQLKKQRDSVKQYQKRIEQSLDRDRELARKCLRANRKDRAKLLLRKKKYQEKLLQNTDAQLENLEKLALDIEIAQVEQQVLEGLKTGNAALSKVHEVLTIEEVERILDETREGVEKQREIDEAISGALTENDENDVLAELDALVSEEEVAQGLHENAPKPEVDISELLPDVPSEELTCQVKSKNEPTKKVLLEA